MQQPTITLPVIGEIAVQLPSSFTARLELVDAFNRAIRSTRQAHDLIRIYGAAIGMCCAETLPPRNGIRLPRYDVVKGDIYGYGGVCIDVIMGAYKVPFSPKLYSESRKLIDWLADSVPREEAIEERVDFTPDTPAAE